MTTTFTINKDDVLTEVAKATGYTGSKMVGEDTAYDRVLATDEALADLGMFWTEACDAVTDLLKPYLTSVNISDDYAATTSMPSGYDPTLTASIESRLQGFFVLYITSRWFKYANKPEAEGTLAEAEGMLQDAKRKIYHRKRPVRPTTFN